MPDQKLVLFLQRPVIINPRKSLPRDKLVPATDVKSPYCDIKYINNCKFWALDKKLKYQ